MIVTGRGDRDQLVARVNFCRHAGRKDRREAGRKVIANRQAGIEIGPVSITPKVRKRG